MKFLTEFLVRSGAPPVIPCSAPGGVIPPSPSLPGHFQLSKKATLVMSVRTQKVDKSIFWLRQELKESQCSFVRPSVQSILSTALNLHLSGFRSLSGLS